MMKWRILMQVLREITCTGSMPHWKHFLMRRRLKRHSKMSFSTSLSLSVLAACDITLRGISQVFLCDNPVSGLFICAGLACTSPELLAYALVGTIFGTIGAALLATAPPKDIAAGLCGYDGALVGCACWASFQPAPVIIPSLPPTSSYTPHKMVAAILLSLLAGVVHVGLANVLNHFSLPTFTFAFNVVTISFLISISTGFSTALSLPSPASSSSNSSLSPLPYDPLTASFFFDSSIKGVGQFMFADTIVGSSLVLLGIAISSRRGALFAFMGASVGCLTGYYLIALPAKCLPALRAGLYGYNSSGACASVGGGVFFDVGIGSSLLAIVAAMLSVLLQVAFQSFFSHLYGVSILTFPFIVSTWIILVTRASHFKTTQSEAERKEVFENKDGVNSIKDHNDEIEDGDAIGNKRHEDLMENYNEHNQNKGDMEEQVKSNNEDNLGGRRVTKRKNKERITEDTSRQKECELGEDIEHHDDVYIGYDAFVETSNILFELLPMHEYMRQVHYKISNGIFRSKRRSESIEGDSARQGNVSNMNSLPLTQMDYSERSNLSSQSNTHTHTKYNAHSHSNPTFNNFANYNEAIQREILLQDVSLSPHSEYDDEHDGDIEDGMNETSVHSLLLPRVNSTSSLRSMSSACSSDLDPPSSRRSSFASVGPPSLHPQSQISQFSSSSNQSQSSQMMKRIASLTNLQSHTSSNQIDGENGNGIGRRRRKGSKVGAINDQDDLIRTNTLGIGVREEDSKFRDNEKRVRTSSLEIHTSSSSLLPSTSPVQGTLPRIMSSPALHNNQL